MWIKLSGVIFFGRLRRISFVKRKGCFLAFSVSSEHLLPSHREMEEDVALRLAAGVLASSNAKYACIRAGKLFAHFYGSKETQSSSSL